MAGYSSTPLYKKLGLRAGDLLVLVDPPKGWAVPDLPDGVSTVTEIATPSGRRSRARARAPARGQQSASTSEPAVIVAFFRARGVLAEAIPALAERIFPAGAVWVAWPRRAAGHESDIREQDIRELALPIGLVDVKVAALDEDWSGLRLVWRRERRGTS
jgi:hypothetical protein